MTNKKQLQDEIDTLNKNFNSMGFSFDLGGGTIYPDKNYDNIKWAKLFIRTYSHGIVSNAPVILLPPCLGKSEVQIGRITYRFTNNIMERYYVKQYKPNDYEYGPEDHIFYHLEYFFATGKILSNLRELIQKARVISTVTYGLNKMWREKNPYPSKKKVTKNGEVYHTHRKKLQLKNIRYILNDLVGFAAGLRTEDPFEKLIANFQ